MAKTTEKFLLKYDPKRENLLPALKEISAAFGCVSRQDAVKISGYFSLPLSKIYETASFYDEIRVKKNPPLVIEVCSSPNCALKNSLKIIKEIESIFDARVDDDFNPKVKLAAVSCMGLCGKGPVMTVNGKIYTHMTTSLAHEILAEYA